MNLKDRRDRKEEEYEGEIEILVESGDDSEDDLNDKERF